MALLPFQSRPEKFPFPVVTILIVLICLAVYFAQAFNTSKFESTLTTFCLEEMKTHKNLYQGTTLDQKNTTCQNVFKGIYFSDNKKLALKLILDRAIKDQDNPRIVHWFSYYLKQKYAEFSSRAPAQDISMQLGLVAGSFDPVHMLTAVFTHGSWWHVVVNVFAFLVFASAAEYLLGRWGFLLLFLFLTYSSHAIYSVLYLLVASPDLEITIGLSGIVFGMMSFMALILYRAKRRFVFWFFVTLTATSLAIQLFVIFSVITDWLHYFSTGGDSRISFRVHWAGLVMGIVTAMLIPLRFIRQNDIPRMHYGLKGTYPLIKYKAPKN
ncbi:hypothetical protein MNBD_GAMMA12-3461 [hydrothermal vent metagenome]|uniref:Peptidase S54 rhomboid domain-containing protein n=1 Tax=hydrothermal vent metagenome TaxID=652676 RepID=A0A3B0Z493_9ZZZZ